MMGRGSWLPGGERPSDDMANQQLGDVLTATAERVRSAGGNVSRDMANQISAQYKELSKDPAFKRALAQVSAGGSANWILKILRFAENKTQAEQMRKTEDPARNSSLDYFDQAIARDRAR